MKKNKLTKEQWQQMLSKMAWSNFCETGEIGAYLFYKEISKGINDARESDKGDSVKSY